MEILNFDEKTNLTLMEGAQDLNIFFTDFFRSRDALPRKGRQQRTSFFGVSDVLLFGFGFVKILSKNFKIHRSITKRGNAFFSKIVLSLQIHIINRWMA